MGSSNHAKGPRRLYCNRGPGHDRWYSRVPSLQGADTSLRTRCRHSLASLPCYHPEYARWNMHCGVQWGRARHSQTILTAELGEKINKHVDNCLESPKAVETRGKGGVQLWRIPCSYRLVCPNNDNRLNYRPDQGRNTPHPLNARPCPKKCSNNSRGQQCARCTGSYELKNIQWAEQPSCQVTPSPPPYPQTRLSEQSNSRAIWTQQGQWLTLPLEESPSYMVL